MNPGMRERVRRLFSSERLDVPSSLPAPGFVPRPPLAKRLNRNALTVAAVVMGTTVITSLVVLRGDNSSNAQKATPNSPPVESIAPTFLDRPTPPSRLPVRVDSASVTASPSSQVSPTQETSAGMRFPDRDAARSASLYPGYPPSPVTSSPQAAPVEEPRRQAFTAALQRSAIANAVGEGAPPATETAARLTATPATLASEEARLLAYGDSAMRSATQGATSLSAGRAAAPPDPRRSFMQQAGDVGGGTVSARLEPAASPFVLRAGSVIPAVLLTAISSDLPGECLGQVSRDVFDSRSQRTLLIPKGSKLMCRYDDQVAAGQGRLLVAWTRLLLPDGRAMTLPGLALKDAQGQTGAKGEVDNHTGRVFGRALLLSAIGAATQLSQPRQASILATPATGQVLAGAVGQELSNVALEIIRRGMDQAPTITVPQGRPFNVFLNGDLVFDEPYMPAP